MEDVFQDKFGREWNIKLTKYDPAACSAKCFYHVSAETAAASGGSTLDFNFFAAFDDVNEAIRKARVFADLLPCI